MSKYTGGLITTTEVLPTPSIASGVWSLPEQLRYKKSGLWDTDPSTVAFVAVTSSATVWGTGTSGTGIDTVTKQFSNVAEPSQAGKRCWFVQSGFRMTNSGGNVQYNSIVGLTVGTNGGTAVSLAEAAEGTSAFNTSVCYFGFSDAYGTVDVIMDIVGTGVTGGDGPLFVCYFDNVNSVEAHISQSSPLSYQFTGTSIHYQIAGTRYLTHNNADGGDFPLLKGTGVGHAQIHIIGINTSNSSSITLGGATTNYTTYLDQDTGTSEHSFIAYRQLIGSSLGSESNGNLVMPTQTYTMGTASSGTGATNCVFRMN